VNPEAPDVDAEAGRLSSQLVKAPDARQGELIERYRQNKGVVYTQALAAAIHQLKGSAKEKARDALAERLARMTAPTLRARMQDEDSEIRRAIALACAMREDQAHVPDLISLLEDPDPMVGRAAHVALKSLTNKDFGPSPGATPQERADAVLAWKAWWKKQNPKS
jgi:HEAT repeat protein